VAARTDNSTATRGRAFTLVELLIVIGILALLIAIMAPTVGKVKSLAKLKASQGTVNLLDGAVEMYRNDFDDVPPSEPGAYNNWYGCQLLPLFLTGYGPDANDKGRPYDGGANLAADDGKDGYGFRIELRGKVYGPYNSAEKVATPGTARPVFVDSFANAILYFVFDQGANEYTAAHNPAATEQPDDINVYCRRSIDLAAPFLRRDFVLISKGIDGEWYDPAAPDLHDKDDATNLSTD